MLVMSVGCLGEVIGWSGRLWSSKSPDLLNPFLMQITTTIISPSFMSAANFTILGAIIRRFGQNYSWLTPRWYLIVFINLDLISLIVQAIGGAKASTEAENNENANPGGHIMLYGIVLQMIALTIYVILGADFVVRYYLNKPVRKAPPVDGTTEAEKTEERPVIDGRTKLMLAGLVLNSIFLFTRAVYRTIELNDGWGGPIITNQALFNWLDGTQITLATYVFNFIHPGYLLRPKRPATSSDTL